MEGALISIRALFFEREVFFAKTMHPDVARFENNTKVSGRALLVCLLIFAWCLTSLLITFSAHQRQRKWLHSTSLSQLQQEAPARLNIVIDGPKNERGYYESALYQKQSELYQSRTFPALGWSMLIAVVSALAHASNRRNYSEVLQDHLANT